MPKPKSNHLNLSLNIKTSYRQYVSSLHKSISSQYFNKSASFDKNRIRKYFKSSSNVIQTSQKSVKNSLKQQKWWSQKSRQEKKANFQPITSFKTSGIYKSKEHQGFVLIGQHTGLKTRKLKRKTPSFSSVVKRDEVLCFFNQPMNMVTDNEKKISSTVHKRQQSSQKQRKFQRSEHISPTLQRSEKTNPSIKVASTKREQYIEGWDVSKTNSQFSYIFEQGDDYFQNYPQQFLSPLHANNKKQKSKQQFHHYSNNSEQSHSTNSKSNSMRYNESFEAIDIVAPSITTATQHVVSIDVIDDGNPFPHSLKTVSIKMTKDQRQNMGWEPQSIRNHKTSHKIKETLLSIDQSNQTKLKKQFMRPVQPSKQTQNQSSQKTKSKLFYSNSEIQKNSDIGLNILRKTTEPNKDLNTQIFHEAVKKGMDQIQSLSDNMKAANSIESLNITHQKKGQIGSQKLVDMQECQQIIEEPENQSMQSSVPLIMTLHSRSGSVKHISDPTDPNRISLRQPTLMMTFVGSAGCIRQTNLSSKSKPTELISKKTLESKLSKCDFLEQKDVVKAEEIEWEGRICASLDQNQPSNEQRHTTTFIKKGRPSIEGAEAIQPRRASATKVGNKINLQIIHEAQN